MTSAGPADPATIAYYDREAAAYAQAAIDHGDRDSLLRFEAALPRGARVLDLGCGAGQESAWLAQRGHLLTSTDASPGLAAEARRRFGLDVRVARFDELEDVALYDGVWSGAALHHAETAALPDIFQRIARALKPGGRFATLMKCGPDRRDAFGRFYCATDRATLEALLTPETWSGVEIRETVGVGHDQVETPWVLVDAVRRG